MTELSMQSVADASAGPRRTDLAHTARRPAWVGVLCLAMLAGCSSTPDSEQSGAQVESRSVGEQGTAKAPAVPAAAPEVPAAAPAVPAATPEVPASAPAAAPAATEPAATPAVPPATAPAAPKN